MPLGVGLIGCGAISTVLAHAIDEGRAGDTRLAVVHDLLFEKSQKLVDRLSSKPRIAKTFDEFIKVQGFDLVIEAASQNAVRQYASKVLENGKDLMIMSVGALVDSDLTEEIRRSAHSTGKKIYIPSGAIVGIDGIKAAVIGRINHVTLTTRKPPSGLIGAPYFKQSRISPNELKEPKVIYEGPASEACMLFPANVNVAATLSLAGIGLNKTKVRIVADPTIKRNVHEINVKGEFGELRVCTKNVPSPDNPKTSFLAVLSAIATLKRITEFMLIGT